METLDLEAPVAAEEEDEVPKRELAAQFPVLAMPNQNKEEI